MINVLKEYLEQRGFEVNTSMEEHIKRWKAWYAGKVKGFHDYTVFNGIKSVEQRRKSLQLGKAACEQWANLLFNEKCEISIDDEVLIEGEQTVNLEDEEKAKQDIVVEGTNPTDAFVKSVFDSNDVYVKLNENQEKKAAFGTIAFIPYYTNDGIKFNYITADNMLPLSWDNGIITELCVWSYDVIDGKTYLFVQLFILSDSKNDEGKQTYNIENVLLISSKDNKDTAAIVDNMASIPGYENVEPIVETKSSVKPFVIDRMNIVNNIDVDSPLGIAVFANAIDIMEACDTIFDSYNNEFILGKKRIMVAPEAMNVRSGKPVFDENEIVFYQLPEGLKKDGDPYIKEMNMDIRSTDHEQSLQNMLSQFSYQTGLGDNFFRYKSGGLATATQVISENNVLFRNLKKHEAILEAVIVDLIRLIIDIGIRHEMADGLNPNAAIIVTFDDSIIEDKDTEVRRRMNMVAAKLIKPEIFLSWYFGVTEEEALAMMPSFDTTDEEGIE